MFALGKTPVTSAVKSTPPDFIVTAPEDTAKLSELKLAIPLLDVVESLAAIVIVVPLFDTPIGLVPLSVKSALPLLTVALPLLVVN